MSYLPYSSKGESMSEYGWIGLAALAAGLTLAGKYGYTASRRFVRGTPRPMKQALRNQSPSWYETAGLAFLGILSALGGAYEKKVFK